MSKQNGLKIESDELVDQRLRTLVETKKQEFRKLSELKTLLEKQTADIISNTKESVVPALKLYHKSKCNFGSGGGGGNAARNHSAVRTKVESILNSNGFTLVISETIPRGSYKKNVRLDNGNQKVQFRLRTRYGGIVNIIVQSQKVTGGSVNKASFFIDSMKKDNSQFIYLFDTNIESVVKKVESFLKMEDNDANVTCTYNLEDFETTIKRLL